LITGKEKYTATKMWLPDIFIKHLFMHSFDNFFLFFLKVIVSRLVSKTCRRALSIDDDVYLFKQDILTG